MLIKHIEDYYEAVHEKFPDLSKKEIAKVLRHGMRSFYMTNLYGADVLLKNPSFTMYIGEMFKDAKKFWNYWHFKNALKYRIKYKRGKLKADDGYYIGLTEEEYDKYHLNKKRRTSIMFTGVYIYKLKEESFLDRGKKYFYKTYVKEDIGFKKYFSEFKTNQLVLIGKRENREVKLM